MVVIVLAAVPRPIRERDTTGVSAQRPAAAVLSAAKGAERVADPLAHEREDERHVGRDHGHEGLPNRPGRGVLRAGHVVGDDEHAAEDASHHDKDTSRKENN